MSLYKHKQRTKMIIFIHVKCKKTRTHTCTHAHTFRTSKCILLSHTGKTAIENVNTVDKRRSKIVKTEFSKWQSKTLLIAIFDPRSSIVKSVFDCCLPGVVAYWVCSCHTFVIHYPIEDMLEWN